MLRELFVFLTGSGVYTLDIFGSPKGVEGDIIYVNHPVIVPRAVRLEPRYFSTRYTDYREVMPSVVRRWFELRMKLRVAVTTYTELLCSDGVSPETILLRTVQTLEHLHGLCWPDDSKYVQKATFRRFLRWLRCHFPMNLDDVSPEEMEKLESNKETLLSRIGGIHNLSFRSRLEKIFKEIPYNDLMPIIDNPPDADKFLESFLKHLEASRHYLTHFDEEQRELAFQEEDVGGAALTCWAALTFWMSRLLGLEDRLAANIALQAKKAMFLVHPGTEL